MFDICRDDRTIRSLAEAAANANNRTAFDPANPRVPVTQKVLDADDYAAMLGAVLEGHLTHGKHAEQFERDIAATFGVRHAAFVNSGSSANLLALAALMDETLGDSRLRPGDEVVTCAAGFPTTVNPIVQLGMVPCFVDVDPFTLNADIESVVDACKRPKVKAVVLAHTLGNPFDARTVVEAMVASHTTWLLEDCCDALGSRMNGKSIGTLGHFATCSHYPAHHCTTIEGGSVATNLATFNNTVKSFRDWGRDCWCPSGKDATCGKRFGWKWATDTIKAGRMVDACLGLPDGYDHKHVFSRLGFNLKGDDIRAALGVSQLKKLPAFTAARKRNHAALYAALEDLQDRLILPQATPGGVPSWFGFAITLKPPLERRAVVDYLESKGCATRPIFSGNIVRQPAYAKVKYEVIGDLANADTVMRQSLYVGCHAGLGVEHIDYLVKCIRKAVTRC